MAVPSAKNSGFERISNLTPGLQFAIKISRMFSAVRTGTVDFSTIILSEIATSAILRMADSNHDISDALPLPRPRLFVGVLTLTKMQSASLIAVSMSVEKKRFAGRPSCSSLADCTTSSKFGSWIGRSLDCHASIRLALRSTIVTETSGFLFAITEHVGPPFSKSIFKLRLRAE